jgi:hypothetical protein
MFRWLIALPLLAAPFASAPAWAASGLAQKAESPLSEPGAVELEVRAGGYSGANRVRVGKIEVSRGLAKHWRVALLGTYEKAPGADARFDSLALESVFGFGRIFGFESGLYLEYAQRLHNESGVIEGKFLLERKIGWLKARANFNAEQPLTERDGEGALEFGYAGLALAEPIEHLEVGLEAHGDLGTSRHFGGRRAHFLGPAVRWEIGEGEEAMGELELGVSYLFNVGDRSATAPGALNFLIEWAAKF